MTTIFDEMLQTKLSATVSSSNTKIQEYLLIEVLQEITLFALSNAGFFEHAAFYGGTALRIFHNLERFSEDLDFCLYKNSNDFNLYNYISEVEKIIKSFGLQVNISIKNKSFSSNIQTSLLKANKRELFILFNLNEKTIHRNENIKIKIELDTTEFIHQHTITKFQKIILPYFIQICDLPTLFSGKIHAILCRKWKSGRIKGRDLFDYVFFSSRNTAVNLEYLQEKLAHSGYIAQDTELTIEMVREFLQEKFKSIAYDKAREDVQHLVFNPYLTTVWSPEFFCFTTRDLQAETRDSSPAPSL